MVGRSHQRRIGRTRLLAGLGVLVIGLAASAALAAYHLTTKELLPCGPQNGCAAAMESRWSTVAGWPVAFFAVCYFGGAMLAWLSSQQSGVGMVLRYAARVAAIVSTAYLALGWQLQIHCPYCLASHIASLAFWMVVETSAKSPDIARSALAFIGGFAVLFAALSVAQSEQRWRRLATAGAQLTAEDTATIDRGSASNGLTGSDRTDRPTLSPDRSDAKVEVTIYTDYSCPVCVEVDNALAAAVEQNENISLTVKNYPLCTDCNPNIGENLHPAACRAAQAAEAARILAADEQGFQQMHAWLFDRRGEFTKEQLSEALPGLGFQDVDEFIKTMDSPEVNRRIQSDIKQAVAMRVDSTPTIFVNGVQLRNWKDGSGLETAILSIARRKR